MSRQELKLNTNGKLELFATMRSVLVFTLIELFQIGAGTFVEAEYHDSLQNHSDHTNNNTWKQAYYVNDAYWKNNAHAPVFICLAGNEFIDGRSVSVASQYFNHAVESAEHTGALLFALSHRYYTTNSSAYPINVHANLSYAEGFRFLTIRNAVGDIVSFRDYIVKKYNLAPTVRVILWGNFYAATLATYVNRMYPSKFWGAVAVHALVRPKPSFYGYMNMNGAAYGSKKVGGSRKCVRIIRDGHRTIGRKMRSKKGRKHLENHFNLTYTLKDENARVRFAGYGVAGIMAQTNDPNCDTRVCNIEKICEYLIEQYDAFVHDSEFRNYPNVRALANLRTLENSMHGRRMDHLEQLNGVRPYIPPGPVWPPKISTVAELWQQCNELGLFITCEHNSKCIYTKGLLTVEYQFHFWCSSIFPSVKLKKSKKQISEADETYGSPLTHPDTRVLWITGDLDPWSANSKTYLHRKKRRKHMGSEKVLVVEGATSLAPFTGPLDLNPPESLLQARVSTKTTVKGWLNRAEIE